MRITSIAFVVALGACGSEAKEPVDNTPVTIESFSAATIDRFCTILVRCGMVDDLETCRTQDLGLHVNADLLSAIQAGKVILHGDKARECLNSLLPSGCDRSLVFSERGISPACDQQFEGTVASGGSCALNDECISGVCSKTTCADDTCCLGMCFGPPRVPAKIGEACSPNRCVDGFCDRTTDTCKAFLRAGASCANDDQCQTGLVCHSTCQAAPGPGEACTISHGCRDLGTVCKPGSLTCTAVGLAGDACRTAEDCSPLYRCGGDGKCALQPQLGESCTGVCGDHSFCDLTAQTCAPPQPDGAVCMAGSACQSGDCDFDTGTCVARLICI